MKLLKSMALFDGGDATATRARDASMRKRIFIEESEAISKEDRKRAGNLQMRGSIAHKLETHIKANKSTCG